MTEDEEFLIDESGDVPEEEGEEEDLLADGPVPGAAEWGMGEEAAASEMTEDLFAGTTGPASASETSLDELDAFLGPSNALPPAPAPAPARAPAPPPAPARAAAPAPAPKPAPAPPAAAPAPAGR